MEEQLERVIRKIILPQYPKIEDVRVESAVSDDNKTTYAVFYTIRTDYSNNYNESKIIHETISLFNMLAPNRGQDYLVVRYECKRN
jgi:hypothetical protein